MKTRIPIRSFEVLPPEEINIIFGKESSLADFHPAADPRAQTQPAKLPRWPRTTFKIQTSQKP